MSLEDPTADYCSQIRGIIEGHIKTSVDGFYASWLDYGLCKADAIWLALEDTQKMFDGFDPSVNFNGPMA